MKDNHPLGEIWRPLFENDLTSNRSSGKYMILEYFKAKMELLGLYLLIVTLFPLLNYLYSYKTDAFVYGLQIITGVLSVYLFINYFNFRRKHTELQKLVSSHVVQSMQLPKSSDLLEKDYQLLLDRVIENFGQMQKMSELQEKEILDYFTNWVHQIKTPISAMNLLLQKTRSGGSPAEDLEQQLFSVERYVDMVIQYLRIGSMENDLDLYEFPIKKILNKCVKKFAPIFINKKISLQLFVCDELVLSDEKWISLIIEQVLSNSLKYTNKGSIQIYMETPDILVIQDTGIGIRSSDIERIFERGFTGYNGRLGEKSSGLGLFLCRKAADKLNIELKVSSELNMGTVMKIVFSGERAELFR